MVWSGVSTQVRVWASESTASFTAFLAPLLRRRHHLCGAEPDRGVPLGICIDAFKQYRKVLPGIVRDVWAGQRITIVGGETHLRSGAEDVASLNVVCAADCTHRNIAAKLVASSKILITMSP